MFETMTGFLWFFYIGLALIVGGILFEEKLVRFEGWIWSNLTRHRADGKNRRVQHGKM